MEECSVFATPASQIELRRTPVETGGEDLAQWRRVYSDIELHTSDR